MSDRSVAAAKARGVVATLPGVNVINGGKGAKPYEAKCRRDNLGCFATEQEAHEAYVQACHARGMAPRTVRATRGAASPDARAAPPVHAGQGATWTGDELARLRAAVERCFGKDAESYAGTETWARIAAELGTGRTHAAVYQKWLWLGRRAASSSASASAPTQRAGKRQRKRTHLPADEVDPDAIVDAQVSTSESSESGSDDEPEQQPKPARRGAKRAAAPAPAQQQRRPAKAARASPPPPQQPTAAARPGGGKKPSSSFYGVEWAESRGQWRVDAVGRMAEPAFFSDEDAAARAYDRAIGQRLNFEPGEPTAVVSADMKGASVNAEWGGEENYDGVITDIHLRHNKVLIHYDDGQEAWEKVGEPEEDEDEGEGEGDEMVLLRILTPSAERLHPSVLPHKLPKEWRDGEQELCRRYLQWWAQPSNR